jgi:hypothetical protein
MSGKFYSKKKWLLLSKIILNIMCIKINTRDIII